jgi:hypothetical protein
MTALGALERTQVSVIRLLSNACQHRGRPAFFAARPFGGDL